MPLSAILAPLDADATEEHGLGRGTAPTVWWGPFQQLSPEVTSEHQPVKVGSSTTAVGGATSTAGAAVVAAATVVAGAAVVVVAKTL